MHLFLCFLPIFAHPPIRLVNDFMRKPIDAIYEYLYEAVDPDESKKRLDNILDFVIRLRHSFVDNDKPVSAMDVNREILEIARREGLRVERVEL